MRQKLGNILWGLAFIVIGIGVAGNMFDVWNFNLFFNGWWTLFIIIPCVISIIQNGFNTGNVIGLAVGALLLISARGIFPRDVAFKLFFPAILIIIGLSIIFGRHYKTSNYTGKTYNSAHAGTAAEGYKGTQYSHTTNNGQNWNIGSGNEILAIFCGNNGSFFEREFKGATCTAIFGGVDLDLRGAKITRDVTIEATAIFGGVEIFTDDTVQVVYRSVPIFGGVDCHVPARDKNLPTVFLNCVAVFGGIDIK